MENFTFGAWSSACLSKSALISSFQMLWNPNSLKSHGTLHLWTCLQMEKAGGRTETVSMSNLFCACFTGFVSCYVGTGYGLILFYFPWLKTHHHLLFGLFPDIVPALTNQALFAQIFPGDRLFPTLSSSTQVPVPDLQGGGIPSAGTTLF